MVNWNWWDGATQPCGPQNSSLCSLLRWLGSTPWPSVLLTGLAPQLRPFPPLLSGSGAQLCQGFGLIPVG